jgi:biotin transport system substrate-specific component
MLAAAALMGVLVRRGWDTSVPRTLGAMLAGTVVIFGVGVTWLGYQVGLQTAIASGVRPFLVSEALKIAIVALALPAARRATQKAMADSTP